MQALKVTSAFELFRRSLRPKGARFRRNVYARSSSFCWPRPFVLLIPNARYKDKSSFRMRALFYAPVSASAACAPAMSPNYICQMNLSPRYLPLFPLF